MFFDGELEFMDTHAPKGIRHGFKNRRTYAARLLFIYTPAGLEQLMLDHSTPARAGETPPPVDDDMIARAEQVIQRSKTIMLP
ncbi:hypothetical protein [Streptomyces sp. NPDC005301]|uniref:hypothetical protein n=1 Tax=Streptomyces sp. NPDC005301 TaxID=3156874 RepID=UPI0033ACA261